MVALDKAKVIRALREEGFEASVDKDLISVCVELEDGSDVELCHDISPGGEFNFPDFYVDLNKHPQLRGLAHVGPLGKICSFDPVTNFPNPRRPEDALVETLKSIVEKLNDSVMGRSQEDYQDEILAYWVLECTGEHVYLFDNPSDRVNTMYGAHARGHNHSLCIAASAESASSFASRLGGVKVPVCAAFPCMALELSVPVSYPFPNTAQEWDQEISKSGKGMANAYRNFVVRSKRETVTIILVAPVEGGKALLCFTQRAVDETDGFRRGPKLYRYAVSRTRYGAEQVEKRRIEDATQGRLFRRGGVGAAMGGVHAIIGCGSLGSHLARALADSGVTRFVLVDNEYLEVGNVARHACGFESVGTSKVESVKRMLESANPNVTCTAHNEDANNLIEVSQGALGEAAVFVTVADPPLEFHLVEAFCSGAISGPLVIMWLEPFMLAAHAIVLNKPQRIFDDGLFDGEFRFAHRVVSNSEELYAREAGCQTTYMPYAGLDVQAFLLDFLKCWQQLPMKLAGKNYRFTWVGRISASGSIGASISPEFAGAEDCSCIVERID